MSYGLVYRYMLENPRALETVPIPEVQRESISHLQNLFAATYPALPKQLEHRSKTLVSFGCGIAPELAALQAWLGDSFANIQYSGFDINRDHIDYLQEQYEALDNICFHHCDLTQVEHVQKLLDDTPIDILLCRHPEFQEYPARDCAFRTILGKTLPAFVSPATNILITTYFAEEMTKVKLALAEGGTVRQASAFNYLGTHQRLNAYQKVFKSDQFVLAITDYQPSAQQKIAPEKLNLLTDSQQNIVLAR